MSAYTIAAIVVLIVATWIALACCVVAFVAHCAAERDRFDAELTAVAEAVGVMVEPLPELSANYRSPLYDHIASAMAAGLDDEYERLTGGDTA